MIVAAKAMIVRVELGIQQGVNSTLNSYLEKLLIMLTGSFGRKGTNQLHSWLQPLWGNSPNQRFAADRNRGDRRPVAAQPVSAMRC